MNANEKQKPAPEEKGPLSLSKSRPTIELPPDAEEMLTNAWDNAPGKQLEPIGKDGIKRRDVLTLCNSRWLTDEVINVYLNMISERSAQVGRLKVHAMSTMFYPKYKGEGYSAVRRWTKKINIFSKQLILFPIHLGNHWCLAVVDFVHRRVQYYDSMMEDNYECLMLIVSYLKQESLEKRGVQFDDTEWTVECRKDIPHQDNTFDCGVFICVFAEYIAREAALDFDRNDMRRFREKIAYELCKGTLLL